MKWLNGCKMLFAAINCAKTSGWLKQLGQPSQERLINADT
jgi:hypothetical protein